MMGHKSLRAALHTDTVASEWEQRVALARQRTSKVSFSLAALHDSDTLDHGRFLNEIRLLREAVDLLTPEVKFA